MIKLCRGVHWGHVNNPFALVDRGLQGKLDDLYAEILFVEKYPGVLSTFREYHINV